MNIGRFIGTAVLATALFAGCKKKDEAAPAAGSGSAAPVAGSAAPADGSSAPAAGSAAPAAGSAAPAAGSASPAAGSAAANPSGGPIAFGILREYAEKLPPPKSPIPGHWNTNSQDTSPGWLEIDLVDDKNDKNYIFTVHIADCRTPAAAAAKTQKPEDQGIWEYCNDATSGTLNNWPVVKINDPDNSLWHVLKVGNMTFGAEPLPNYRDKISDADVDAYLKSLDLTALSKM